MKNSEILESAIVDLDGGNEFLNRVSRDSFRSYFLKACRSQNLVISIYALIRLVSYEMIGASEAFARQNAHIQTRDNPLTKFRQKKGRLFR